MPESWRSVSVPFPDSWQGNVGLVDAFHSRIASGLVRPYLERGTADRCFPLMMTLFRLVSLSFLSTNASWILMCCFNRKMPYLTRERKNKWIEYEEGTTTINKDTRRRTVLGKRARERTWTESERETNQNRTHFIIIIIIILIIRSRVFFGLNNERSSTWNNAHRFSSLESTKWKIKKQKQEEEEEASNPRTRVYHIDKYK